MNGQEERWRGWSTTEINMLKFEKSKVKGEDEEEHTWDSILLRWAWHHLSSRLESVQKTNNDPFLISLQGIPTFHIICRGSLVFVVYEYLISDSTWRSIDDEYEYCK